MLGALIKAFTGRAGLLASLLSLLIIAVIAAAVVLGIPRMEQKLLIHAEAFLETNLAENDVLSVLKADGRTLHLEARAQNAAALEQNLAALEGVRNVVFREIAYVEAADTSVLQASSGQTPDANVDTAQTQDSLAEQLPASSTPARVENNGVAGTSTQNLTDQAADGAVQEAAPAVASSDQTSNTAQTDHVIHFNQASLSVRYDGPKLVLTGHLVDQPTINLITEAVSDAIPPFSTLEIDVDNRGETSSLGWLDNFLTLVKGLPDDAQGTIHGSDHKGVWIDADKEQTFFRQNDGQPTINAAPPAGSSEAAPADVFMAEESRLTAVDSTVAVDSTNEQATVAGEMNVSAAEPDAEPEALVDAEILSEDTQAVPAQAQEGTDNRSPAEYILWLNQHLASNQVFQTGGTEISEALSDELVQLVDMMDRNPDLLLRVMGNIDFGVDARDGQYVGIDRAREVRDYMRSQGVDPFRVFTEPLPYDYAFEESVQIVFYISE